MRGTRKYREPSLVTICLFELRLKDRIMYESTLNIDQNYMLVDKLPFGCVFPSFSKPLNMHHAQVSIKVGACLDDEKFSYFQEVYVPTG